MPKIFTETDRNLIRTKLLEAGLTELNDKSYRSISLDDITASVGIAKGTFYNFFPSKESFFYEVMQLIKENNREDLKELFRNGTPSKSDIEKCLYHRYTQVKTVYDYLTPEEIKIIVRKLPNGDVQNDSAEFAETLCKCFHTTKGKADPKIIVNTCNVLGLASSNRNMLEESAYSETIRLLCRALTDYIFEEVK